MKRTKHNRTPSVSETIELVRNVVNTRARLAQSMGASYNGYRKLYDSLGYPKETELDYNYFEDRYKRQEIATAIIDRPVEMTWNGSLQLLEAGTTLQDSTLNRQWETLNNKLKIKQELSKLDKLVGIGGWGLLLLGLNDVKDQNGWQTPAGGRNLKLLYVKAVSAGNAVITEYETNPANERFGQPRTYDIKLAVPGSGETASIKVHWSRVLHVTETSAISGLSGRSRLKPIINRLIDLEKLLGGDAEMFWRGARPGYTALPREGYEMGDDEIDALEGELDKYEHDLRRFLTAQGVDIKAMEQQVADPINHFDIQLQAISAQTGIPKRILIGTERGELASSQDRDSYLTLIKTRMEEFAEVYMMRPLVDVLMKYGVLPAAEYQVMWEDMFSPSEKEKAEIGKIRADALKSYSQEPSAQMVLPPNLALRYLCGLTDEQVAEVMQDLAGIDEREDNTFRVIEGEDGDVEAAE